ncbi:MAG TPA: DUF3553 domain-containing protein [Acetobacteraceae bacterium]|nr:DUF3553 domain-containing protein [Acetobacteraceae bacterium]
MSSSAPKSSIEPGCWVFHPEHPEWGAGQVQSAVGDRVTANFEHAGKVLINTGVIRLEVCGRPEG